MDLNIAIVLISFLASFIRSTFGFGEALVALPLLALMLPLHVAVPLALMLSIAIALLVIVQDHQHIHFNQAKWLILSAIPGIPLGLYLMLQLKEGVTKIALGLLICLFSIYSLLKKQRLNDQNNKSAHKNRSPLMYLLGFISGILGGAYGLNGPPLVYYGDRQGWSAKHFRATLQAYFLPASTIALAGFIAKSIVTAQVLHYFIIALPSAIPAVYLGRWLNKQFTTGLFFKIVYVFLLMLGTILLLSNL